MGTVLTSVEQATPDRLTARKNKLSRTTINASFNHRQERPHPHHHGWLVSRAGQAVL